MTVVYPVVEQIAQKIVTRLQDVTVVNGYQSTVSSVVRPTKLGGYSPADFMAILEQGERFAATEGHFSEAVPAATEWIQPFLVVIFRQASDTDTTPIDQLVNIFVADIEKGLTLGFTPTVNWQQFGGLAKNSELHAPQLFAITDGQFAGAIIQIDVTYRTAENDPYVLA